MNKIYLTGKVRVTDPCYDINEVCAETVEGLKEGNYIPLVKYNKDERVSAILLIHEDFEEVWKELPANLVSNNICVDSGTCGIFDYDYYIGVADANSDYVEGTWYYRAGTCADTEEQADTIDNKGLVSSSGWGDGRYPLYDITSAEGKKVGLELRYIMED